MIPATKEINDIREILPELTVEALREIKDFASYLADREERRRQFVKEVRSAEQEPPIRFKSAEDAMAAIRNEAGI